MFHLFLSTIVKFNKVIKFAINEERRIFLFDFEIIILIYRFKNKVKEKSKFTYSYNNLEYNRETYNLYKIANRKYRYFSTKC